MIEETNREDERQAELPDFDALTTEIHEGFDAINNLIIRGGAVLFGTLVIGFLSLAVAWHY